MGRSSRREAPTAAAYGSNDQHRIQKLFTYRRAAAAAAAAHSIPQNTHLQAGQKKKIYKSLKLSCRLSLLCANPKVYLSVLIRGI